METKSLDPIPDINDAVEPTSTVRSRFPKPRLPKWLIGCLGLFLLLGGSYAAYSMFASASEKDARQRMMSVSVERADLAVTVTANGTVEPETLVNISPKTAGMMTQLLIKEGDFVQKGQVLARMDDSNLKGQFLQEQGKVARAEANLAKLVNGNRSQEIAQAEAKVSESQATLSKLQTGNRPQEISQAQARLESAQASFRQADEDYKRYQALFSSGAIARQLLDQKRADRLTAQAQVAEAQEALSLQKEGSRKEDIAQARAQMEQQQQVLSLLREGTRQEEIDQARADLTTAQGSLKTVQALIEDTFVRAPFSGTVIKKYADPGAFVTPMTSGSSVDSATSSSILSLASTNRVDTSVAESNISKIKLGQSVKITADAYPGKIFQGKVTQIATQATVKQNVTSFEVKVAILDDREKLLHSGMNTSVEFQVGELTGVLTVPSVAVTRQNNITGVMMAVGDEPPRFRPIKTGVTLNNRTEVKEGLHGDERIMMAKPPKPKSSGGFSFFGFGAKEEGPPGGGPPGGGPPGGEGGPPGGGGPPSGGGAPRGGGGPPR